MCIGVCLVFKIFGMNFYLLNFFIFEKERKYVLGLKKDIVLFLFFSVERGFVEKL